MRTETEDFCFTIEFFSLGIRLITTCTLWRYLAVVTLLNNLNP
jgi:hypothetical protein